MAWRKGVPKPPEIRAKIRAAKLGRKHTPEAIAKMRAAKLGKPPAWVPADLHEEYRDVRRIADEFAACAHIRLLLKEMRA